MKIIGPFTQIVPLADLPFKGRLNDDALTVIYDAGVLVKEHNIVAVDTFEKLRREYTATPIEHIHDKLALIPGFIDCHTHICYAGSRAKDYASRVSGKSYLEIAQAGGGIWNTVRQTRLVSESELIHSILKRAEKLFSEGATTIEVKSGYGLERNAELRILKAIASANQLASADLISTCLAAHVLPKDFSGDESDYLDFIIAELMPVIKKEKLSGRFDIFVEQSAFHIKTAIPFLQQVKTAGFDLTVHADQFTTGGSKVAVTCGAVSADHLEASGEHEIALLAKSATVAVALPGASLGLGMPFTPARKLLDAGACLAIASDWNPGSAPMGQLLTQAAILGAYEKLSLSETLSAITFRAARALNLTDRGAIAPGKIADLQAYPTDDYRDILYHQGSMKPCKIWKKGQQI
ncbi:imidazolonepropionase [Olivibacter sp. SDN3]|uniref:imidazolonepropionase n=1 Tax=Olivibacter sp. SDN3 TaxID=2764720 RepID=UPI00165111F3|nr:imidazolonepropionase [Olivibacter sp. SDN3]QNL48537.1 imidazolonepropionase [Olivibacter sp. SDN3]